VDALPTVIAEVACTRADGALPARDARQADAGATQEARFSVVDDLVGVAAVGPYPGRISNDPPDRPVSTAP
jgi:hypothetical protein